MPNPQLILQIEIRCSTCNRFLEGEQALALDEDINTGDEVNSLVDDNDWQIDELRDRFYCPEHKFPDEED